MAEPQGRSEAALSKTGQPWYSIGRTQNPFRRIFPILTRSGSGSLTIEGGGAVTLLGGNTYSGVTTISSGQLNIGNFTTTGTLGTGAVHDNGVLAFARTDTITVANTISGTGQVSSSLARRY